MAKPFDDQQDLNSRMLGALIESTDIPGQAAMAVCNPDGTEIGGSGGPGVNVNIHDSAGANITNGQQTMANSVPVALASNQSAISAVGNVASGVADAGNPVKIGGVFNTAAPVLANGQRGDVQLDVSANVKNVEQFAPVAEDNANGVIAVSNKPLAVSTYSWLRFVNLGANNTLNVKATSGNVGSIYCHNLNVASRYIQIHNTATTPGGGAVPALTYLVPGGGTVFVDLTSLGQTGDNFSTGIAFGFSTTEGTFTGGTAGDQVTIIHYV